MAISIPPAVAELIATAFASGAEISLAELSALLDLDSGPVLQNAQEISVFVAQLGLEFAPPLERGEFTTPRVLRPHAQHGDPHSAAMRLLALGEGPTVEFKASMLVSMKEWKQSGDKVEYPGLQGELLKTICAFLNSDGGDLMVGVADDAVPTCGIQLDLEARGWNTDKWELHFQSLIVDRFHNGRELSPYLRTSMFQIDEQLVFHVSVLRRSDPSFVRRDKGKPYEFFVRTGPRTESLDLPSFLAHFRASGLAGRRSS